MEINGKKIRRWFLLLGFLIVCLILGALRSAFGAACPGGNVLYVSGWSTCSYPPASCSHVERNSVGGTWSAPVVASSGEGIEICSYTSGSNTYSSVFHSPCYSWGFRSSAGVDVCSYSGGWPSIACSNGQIVGYLDIWSEWTVTTHDGVDYVHCGTWAKYVPPNENPGDGGCHKVGCAAGQSFDRASCSCKCLTYSGYVSCPSPKIPQEETCTCVCPGGSTCEDPWHWNDSCECVCDYVHPVGLRLNDENGLCVAGCSGTGHVGGGPVWVVVVNSDGSGSVPQACVLHVSGGNDENLAGGLIETVVIDKPYRVVCTGIGNCGPWEFSLNFSSPRFFYMGGRGGSKQWGIKREGIRKGGHGGYEKHS